MHDIAASIRKLEYICETVPAKLSAVDAREFTVKPSPEKWSKKEILGHLIDSATNNHHRLVRGQFESQPKIAYDNNVWNRGNHYQSAGTEELIVFWTAYNRYLLALVKRIPKESLSKTVATGEPGEHALMNLAFVVEDYVVHLEYHLKQLIDF